MGPRPNGPKVRKLLFGPRLWFVGGEQVARSRIAGYHNPVVRRPEEQIVSVPRPLGVRTAAVRDLPFPATVRERPHIDLVAPRIVGRIGHPPAVRRKSGVSLVERRSQETLHLAGVEAATVAFHRHGPDIVSASGGQFVD